MQKSKTRQDCERAVANWAPIVTGAQLHIENPQLLYCGVAGNPRTHYGKPGLDQPELFGRYNITTIDYDKKWEPDIVGDITKPDKWTTEGYVDLLIITQVIEHIPNIWDLSEAFRYIVGDNGYVIVDCPWNYPYHAEEPSFGDYWRISKDGMRTLFKDDFEFIGIVDTDANTSCLMKAK